jgi:phage tail protein X
MLRRYAPVFVALCIWASLGGSAVAAETPAPGWQVMGHFIPTNLPPGGTAKLVVFVFDDGALPGVATVTVTMPPGVTVAPGGPCAGTATVVTCSNVNVEGPGERYGSEAAQITIPVEVASSPPSSPEPVKVTVGGGGAPSSAKTSVPAIFNSAPAPFGLAAFDVWASNANGTTDTQAGSHPFEQTVTFMMNQVQGSPTGGELRDIDVKLPPGLIGNAQAVPRCPRYLFDSGELGEDFGQACPPDTRIGVEWAGIGDGGLGAPVFNLAPPSPGIPALFAFNIAGGQVYLEAHERSGGDYGITIHTPDLPQRKITYSQTTIFGTPQGVPFLTLPTSCEGPRTYTAEVIGSYEDENARSTMSIPTHDNEGNPVGFTGCERLTHFEPSVTVAPDTTAADTPAGLTADVQVPQGANPEGLATSGLRDTTVVLPEGIAINPGQATGLVACQPSEENIGGESEAFDGPSSCPLASKVGTDEVTTPLLPDKLQGNVYVLSPSPPNLQLLVTASGDGVNLKVVGKVHLNEATGQLTTTFENTPDVTFSDFKLSFSGGAQAALVTPTQCGTYEGTSTLTPWASPFVETAFSSNRFIINTGPGGSACQSPLPFAPTMTAGATTDQAGGYTSFAMLLTRGDGQQRIERLQFKTPEGLLGMISNVPLCQEPQAAKGECAAASQIGHTVAEAGPGPYPFVIPEPGAPPAPIYLTGPYEGAPFGLSIAVPVVAGPFNLGTEVVRAKIEVDPHTSQLTITTTAFPRTVKGIPTDIRAIDAVIDRHEFMFNPTGCSPMSFSGTAYSTEGATAPLASHFQMGSCRALTFKPNLQVSTSGKTSRANGASLTAKIVYPVGNLGFNQASSQSNIQTIKVELPKRLPSRLVTLQKACTAAVFEANPGNCPAASVVGHATAITPVLPVPLAGPAYFVSHGGEAFPSLIVVLQGYGVTVDLVGSTFISKAGITSSTFKQVPDVPIGSFELVLPEGPYSALAANGNLCKGTLSMPTEFTGQNGAFLKRATKIDVTGCPKAKKITAKHKTKGGHKKAKAGRRHPTTHRERVGRPLG